MAETSLPYKHDINYTRVQHRNPKQDSPSNLGQQDLHSSSTETFTEPADRRGALLSSKGSLFPPAPVCLVLISLPMRPPFLVFASVLTAADEHNHGPRRGRPPIGRRRPYRGLYR